MRRRDKNMGLGDATMNDSIKTGKEVTTERAKFHAMVQGAIFALEATIKFNSGSCGPLTQEARQQLIDDYSMGKDKKER